MIDSAVCNSSCLISLERIQRLEILKASFTSVYIPPAVRDELDRDLSWLKVRAVRNTTAVNTLKTQAGAGEAEAITLANELKDWLDIPRAPPNRLESTAPGFIRSLYNPFTARINRSCSL